MTRKEELAEVKSVIAENYCCADCGLFFTRNVVGDRMETIFGGEFFTVDICYGYTYFEVFGCDEAEASELKAFYAGIPAGDEEARNG